MATARTTIELNGKLYDARTGKIIDTGGAIPEPKAVNRQNGAVLDGFVRRGPSTVPAVAKPKPVVSRTTSQSAKPKLEKSKTLMRPAVKKPQAVTKNATNFSAKQEYFKKGDLQRTTRASNTPRSTQIKRFNSGDQHKIIKKKAVLSVATPAHTPANQQIANQVAHLATSTEAHLKQSVDVIEESLRSASAHLQTFEGGIGRNSFLKRIGFKNKTANIASMAFAGLLLCGFFAYQNAPNIEMRIAATRSGVSAHMPGYSPAGFSAARDIKSEPGKVSVSFRSNTNDKKFTVTQQASNWSSDSLLSNHVLATKTAFQTYQDEGKIVYIYNNSNATWVNGGVWYRVEGDASLTSDQLLRIANSL